MNNVVNLAEYRNARQTKPRVKGKIYFHAHGTTAKNIMIAGLSDQIVQQLLILYSSPDYLKREAAAIKIGELRMRIADLEVQ